MTRTFLRLSFALLLAGCARNADGKPEAAAAGTLGASNATTPEAVAATKVPVATPETDSLMQRADLGRIMGSQDAKVWMIVVSDFQCPYCREWHAKVAEPLRKEYVQTGKVRIAYLNFPLGQHQHAWPAAEVAMCSGVQGKFWPVHDAIFATQDRWKGMSPAAGATYFDSLAIARGVEPSQLRACVNAKTLRPLIQADYDRSRNSGVQSTPTVIIGNDVLPGVESLDVYKRLLDAAVVAAARPAP